MPGLTRGPAKGSTTRPPRLTQERERTLLAAVEVGESMRSAAEAAGIGERTLSRYMARGLAAQEHLDTYVASLSPVRRQVMDRWTDERLTDHLHCHLPRLEHFYWRIWQEVTRAQARAEAWSVAKIREAGNGYEQTETVEESRQVMGRDGQVLTLTSRRTVRRYVQDWRAAAFLLTNGPNKREWAKPDTRVEIGGREGGPVEVQDVTAARARTHQALDQLELRRQQKAEAEAQAEAESGRLRG